MKIRYTVTAIPKDPVKTEKVYKDVYDINHCYHRNETKTVMNHEILRILIYSDVRIPRREIIDLTKNDVVIHLEEEDGTADI